MNSVRTQLHKFFLRLDRENRLIQIGIMPHIFPKNFDKNGKYRLGREAEYDIDLSTDIVVVQKASQQLLPP